MRRGLQIAAVVAVTATAIAATEGVLVCKQPYAVLDNRFAPPTDVAVDPQNRAYLLYEQEGFLDIYDGNGRMLQHRGGEAENERRLISITPVSMWVGREGRSALLVAENKQQVIKAVLVPDKDKLVTIPLSGHPDPLSGPAALGRDLQGRIYVWTQNPAQCVVFDSDGYFLDKQTIPSDRRPVQLAIDSTGKLYCLDTAGLKVVDIKGNLEYEVNGATAMYLTAGDYLCLVSRDWLRRYDHNGKMEKDIRSLELLRKYEPIAVSINDDGQFFVYGRDPFGGAGEICKISTSGEVLTEFPQPSRTSATPDPGTRLDYQGRIRFWEKRSEQWQKLHPGGKQEGGWKFLPETDPRGHLTKPSDVAIGSSGDAWVADTGNFRLQRFNLKGGWLKPISIGIRGGPAKACPRSLALGRGVIHCVVHPPNGNGEVVLQARDRDGHLVQQKSICPAIGEPVVKVACNAKGEIFLYQSKTKTNRGWQESPGLSRLDPNYNVQLAVGGDNVQGLYPPGNPSDVLNLKPQEDIVPYGQGLLVPCNGKVYRLNPQLVVEGQYRLKLKPGRVASRRLEDFGGSCIGGSILYLADMGNQCLQRAILP